MLGNIYRGLTEWAQFLVLLTLSALFMATIYGMNVFYKKSTMYENNWMACEAIVKAK